MCEICGHLMKLAQASTKHWKWPYQECHKKPGNGFWGRTQAQARARWGTAGAEPAGSSSLLRRVPGDTAPWPLCPHTGEVPSPTSTPSSPSKGSSGHVRKIAKQDTASFNHDYFSHVVYVDVPSKKFPRRILKRKDGTALLPFRWFLFRLLLSLLLRSWAGVSLCLKAQAGSVGSNLSH